MAQALDLLPSKFFAPPLRRLLAVGLLFCTYGHTQASLFTASFAPPSQASPVSPAAIAYTFRVDKARPSSTDSLIYTITVWNDPFLGDTLRSVEAEFLLPRFVNNNFALQLATFRYNGPHPFIRDAVQGKITWRLGDIVRRLAPATSDTVRLVFSFHLADVSEFALECGENPFTAFARVSFLDNNGQHIFPGTQRAAESTLVLTADFVALTVANDKTTIQRGDTLARTYTYRNAGNAGRSAQLCLQIPHGFSVSGIRVAPDTLRVRAVAPDSICVELGFVPAGASNSVTLFLPVEQNLSAQTDSLCLRGALVTDCDRAPANNFYRQNCVATEPLDLLAISKSAERNLVSVGDTLRYTIRYENLDARVTAWHVTITDILPPGVELIAADSGYTFANGVLVWQRAQLTPRQSGAFRFSVRVRSDYYATQAPNLACTGAALNNNVSITSTAEDGSPSPESPQRLANNRSTAMTSLAPLGDLLSITQNVIALAPANLARLLPGDTLLYVLTYANRNPRVTASNVTVIDSLPDARFAELVLPAPLFFVYDQAAHVLRRENFSLASEESSRVSFRLVVRNANALCTTLNLVNRGRLFDASAIDCRLDNNTSSATVALPAQQNLLQLILQAPASVAPNNAFDLVLNYENLGELVLNNVSAREALPAPFIIQTINNAGVLLAANQIEWRLGALAPRASGSVSVRVQAPDSSFCAPLAVQNLAWLTSEPRDCDTRDDTSRVAITITASPQEEQARLLVQAIELSDSNDDGCAEVGERIMARVFFINQNRRNLTAQQIRFIDPRAFAGGRAWPMTLLDLMPNAVAPNDTGLAVLEFLVGENDFNADTLTFSVAITATGFCEQAYQNVIGFGVRFCPAPEVVLTRVDINDESGDRDGLASESETLNLIVVYQNLGPIVADSVDATITLSLPGFTILRAQPQRINALPVRLRARLAPGESDSVFVQVRYDNFSFSDQVIVLSASLQVTALAGPQPAEIDQIFIRRDCFARPNPFIPSHHPNGVRFAPNDGESVKIFDAQGYLVRALRTSQRWDGRDERGELCNPGVYIWKIANACEGTIVVVR